jgi:predicted NUDIX family NTP pyrophosphohydrolase
MSKRSAGILLYRHTPVGLEVFLVHPGGPFWAKKDAGAWGIPKGECQPGETTLAAARREFAEETGFRPEGHFVELGSFRQSSAKTVDVWVLAGDVDPAKLQSNTFQLEWPPKSGRMQEFPEVDRAAWFTPPEAGRKILRGQVPILEAFYVHLGVGAKTQRPR